MNGGKRWGWRDRELWGRVMQMVTKKRETKIQMKRAKEMDRKAVKLTVSGILTERCRERADRNTKGTAEGQM